MNNLDVKTIESLKKRSASYRVSDGGGLLLEVKPSGAKVWLCRLTVHGRRRDMGLGGWPTITLKAAREAAAAVRRQAEAGIDPIAARQAEEAARRAAAEAAARAAEQAQDQTFSAVAEACIRSLAPGFKNARTADMWRASLKMHAAALSAMPVAEIDRSAVQRAVEVVWRERPGMAAKVLRRIGTVLRFAAAHGMRANDNPADPKMLRHAGLPALAGGRKQPSLPWQRVPAFMQALEKMSGLAPLALRFCILTALRSGEVRGARWSEISFEGEFPVWTIPSERMKGKKSVEQVAHRVPLSSAAVEVLLGAYSAIAGAAVTVEDLPRRAALRGDALIFPSAKLTTPLSDMALSAVMRRMNAERPKGTPAPWRDPDGRDAVPHGFRASFSTWVDDTRPTEREAAEKALAHEVQNKVSGAYRRSDLLDRRALLMREWATHCTKPPVESVTMSAAG